MRSHTFALPLYLFDFTAFVRRQMIPSDCKMLQMKGPADVRFDREKRQSPRRSREAGHFGQGRQDCRYRALQG
ncbi:hypothetical protein C3731_03565 [Brucella oryzae]|uniref:Uncharacterized protein n=1 Tax=Brucella oryzae TaxID=335286 RepID=A0A2S7J362_9HYPH|nr:hypothetical protein C3731_03565 [Brucella oryzae]